jgi:hypothetical protein
LNSQAQVEFKVKLFGANAIESGLACFSIEDAKDLYKEFTANIAESQLITGMYSAELYPYSNLPAS